MLSCLGILLVNGAVVLWLLLLGRSVLPETVPLRWWSGSTLSADNSQHVMDFYSPLHAMSARRSTSPRGRCVRAGPFSGACCW